MRTKSILLAAALTAAGVASSMAQSNVYSLNVVGYVNVTSGVGFSMIANPLDAGTNTIGNLIGNPPDGTLFYSWTGSAFNVATFAFGAWDNPNVSLAPGQGGFINTSSAFTNTFVGTVLQGNLTNHFGVGFTIASSQVPQSDTVDNLGLTAALGDGDLVYKWNFGNQAYDVFTLAFGSWSPSTPSINVGESVFLNSTAGGNWVRNFTVQ